MNKRLQKWITQRMKSWVDKRIRKDHKALLDAKRDELTELLRTHDLVGIVQNGKEVGQLFRSIEAFREENEEEFDLDKEYDKFFDEAHKAAKAIVELLAKE